MMRRLYPVPGLIAAGLLLLPLSYAQAPAGEKQRIASEHQAGDAPADPGPLATGLSEDLKPAAIHAAMRKVADWQVAREEGFPSQDWTFATLYDGLLSASVTLHEPRYESFVLDVAQHFSWTLGPRKTHADDQAIGKSYLWLNHQKSEAQRIQPTQTQFDEIMQQPDDPQKPVWWWCDALYMAPPVWSGLAQVTHQAKYLDYMDREWKITADLLYDKQEHLFFRDKSYLGKTEKNGRKLFWSRGNGWVLGGLVRVLETLPEKDPRRAYYVEKFKEMSNAVAPLQGSDGLWRSGLLDANAYPGPEVSGSAFFVYAFAWGVNHHLLDAARFRPVVDRGWAGLVHHIYADGRLGSIQQVGAAPDRYSPGSSWVYGVGAFLLAGSEVDHLVAAKHK